MTTKLNDSATRRATVAMMRSLGASEIIVRTAVATGADPRGLGLDQFEVAETRLSLALVKQVGDKPLRFEIFLPASEVEAKLNLDESSACDALRQLVGICWGDHLLRVTGVTAELVVGRAYLYKISAEG